MQGDGDGGTIEKREGGACGGETGGRKRQATDGTPRRRKKLAGTDCTMWAVQKTCSEGPEKALQTQLKRLQLQRMQCSATNGHGTGTPVQICRSRASMFSKVSLLYCAMIPRSVRFNKSQRRILGLKSVSWGLHSPRHMWEYWKYIPCLSSSVGSIRGMYVHSTSKWPGSFLTLSSLKARTSTNPIKRCWIDPEPRAW